MRHVGASAVCVKAVLANRLRFLLASGVALAALSAFSLAHAAGTALPEQGIDEQAHAFGGATVDDDPSIAYTNPAGMVLIKGNEFEGDLNFYDISSKFSGVDTASGGQVPGESRVKNFLDPTLIPATFAINSLPGGLKFGLTITTPNGGRIKYPNDFVGRYQGTEALLTEIQAGFMFAVPITDSFSIGGGPILDFFQNYVSLNQSQGIFDSETPNGNGAEGRFRGSSYSPGYDVGAMYQFSPDTRIGLNYHSKITHDIKGTETIAIGNLQEVVNQVGILNPILSLLGTTITAPPYASPATDKFVFPQSVSFGLYQRINEQLDVMASAQWTDWQEAGDLLIADPTTAQYTGGIIYTPFHYRNTWTIGLGVDYYVVPKLKLMGGVGYDETPVRSFYRNDLLPDNNRFQIGAGFTMQVLPNLKTSVAYEHYFIAPTAIMQSRVPLTPSGPAAPGAVTNGAGTLNGEYNLSANVFSTGLVLSF